MHFPKLLSPLAFALSLSVPAAATVRYVAPGGSGNGSSWSSPFGSVGAALNASQAGDEVWVAAGTYAGTVTVPSGVGLFGGFAGSETSRSQRLPAANRTILDGDGTGTVVTISSGATRDTIVSGFTIRGGSAANGGGLVCPGSPTIVGNTITGNTATSSGGGIRVTVGSPGPLIAGNIIAGNTGPFGGGIVLAPLGRAVIVNNTVVGNTGSTNGGGVYIARFCVATLTNNIIASNTSGVYFETNANAPTLSHNDVFGNTAYEFGGAFPSYGPTDFAADPLFADAASGDYRLTLGSPALDAGDPAAPQPEGIDAEGGPRVEGAVIDLGALEGAASAPGPAPADVLRAASGLDLADPATMDRNGDGLVTLVDVLLIFRQR